MGFFHFVSVSDDVVDQHQKSRAKMNNLQYETISQIYFLNFFLHEIIQYPICVYIQNTTDFLCLVNTSWACWSEKSCKECKLPYGQMQRNCMFPIHSMTWLLSNYLSMCNILTDLLINVQYPLRNSSIAFFLSFEHLCNKMIVINNNNYDITWFCMACSWSSVCCLQYVSDCMLMSMLILYSCLQMFTKPSVDSTVPTGSQDGNHPSSFSQSECHR